MIPSDPKQQAAFIMSTGKRIRDRTIHLQHAETGRTDKETGFKDMTMAQSIAIMTVKDYGPISVTGLARHLCVSPPSASAMVERLVERGILSRETDPADRRKVLIRLSFKTDRDYERICGIILQDFVDLVQKVGPDTARKWCEVLADVREVIDAQQPVCLGGPEELEEKE